MKYLVIFLSLFAFTLNAQVGQKLKLRQIEPGPTGQFVKADSSGTPIWGTDNNGIYGGSDTIPKETYAIMPPDLDYNYNGDIAFGMGYFSNFPDFNYGYPDKGLWWNFDYGYGPHLVMSGTGGGSDFYSTIVGAQELGTYILSERTNGSYAQTRRISFLEVHNNYQARALQYGTNIQASNISDMVTKSNRRVAIILGRGDVSNNYGDISPTGASSDTSLFWRLTYQEGGSSNTGRDVISIKMNDSTSNNIALYGWKYKLPNAQPSKISSAISIMSWAGSGGTSTTPAFTRLSYSTASGTTDGSGDITITHNLPDASFAASVIVNGTTSYTTSIHTKGATTFKIRFFNPATGAAVTATGVSVDWVAFDN